MADNVTPDNFGFKKPADDIHVEESVGFKESQIKAETLINFARYIRRRNWPDEGTAEAIAIRADEDAKVIMATAHGREL